MDPNVLQTTPILDLPIRLLQSAGAITTSRITAFIEHLLSPISVIFCKYRFEEYCCDSKDYLESLAFWKQLTSFNPNVENLYITAGDVKSLYPNISRPLALTAVRFALSRFTTVCAEGIPNLIELLSLCMESVIVQHGESFYSQSSGIVTGDNYSVSIANLTLHYALLPVADVINTAVIFRRFIDDIVWISHGTKNTKAVQDAVDQALKSNNLELSFRSICTGLAEQGKSLEFLDVDHVIDMYIPAGFYTKDFLKSTATDRTFLHG